jgi:hypothetical protein
LGFGINLVYILENFVQFLLHLGFALFNPDVIGIVHVFQYLRNKQEDFFIQILFPLKYFLEIFVKRIADSPHTKYFPSNLAGVPFFLLMLNWVPMSKLIQTQDEIKDAWDESSEEDATKESSPALDEDGLPKALQVKKKKKLDKFLKEKEDKVDLTIRQMINKQIVHAKLFLPW